jgi:hypothetical protein
MKYKGGRSVQTPPHHNPAGDRQTFGGFKNKN